jgi:IS5 family transposase
MMATLIPDMEAFVGNTIACRQGISRPQRAARLQVRVFLSGQKRGVTPQLKRELRCRSAFEPIIGDLKAEHRMGRNYLWFRQGDQ